MSPFSGIAETTPSQRIEASNMKTTNINLFHRAFALPAIWGLLALSGCASAPSFPPAPVAASVDDYTRAG